MPRYRPIALFAASLVVAIGLFILQRPEQSPSVPLRGVEAHVVSPLRTSDSREPSLAQDEQIRKAASNPIYLRMLLDRYRRWTDPEAKVRLRRVLAAVANEDVRDTALALAVDRDPQRRRDGIELLQSFSAEDPQVRAYLLTALSTERDPDSKVGLLRSLGRATVPIEDRDAIAEILVEAAIDPIPEIRTTAIQRLAGWLPAEHLEEIYLTALDAPETEVRQAALEAIGRSGLRSRAVATAMLASAENRDRPEAERSLALALLQDFE
jgi:hypothetical protein